MSWTVYYSSTRRSMGSFDITCVAFSRLTLPIFTSVMGLVQSKLKSNGIFRTVFLLVLVTLTYHPYHIP